MKSALAAPSLSPDANWALRPSASRKTTTAILQAICLALVLTLSARKFYGAYGAENALVNLLSWLPVLVRGSLVGFAMTLAYLAMVDRPGLRSAWHAPFFASDVLIHFGSAALLFTGGLYAPSAVSLSAEKAPMVLAYYLALPLFWLGYIAFGLRIVLSGWPNVDLETRQKAFATGFATLLAFLAWRLFERSAFPNAILLTEAAVRIAGLFSLLIGHPITRIGIDPHGWPIYRTGGLDVAIAPNCAGLEGIVLSSCLLLAVVLIERKSLRIGRAVALIALAGAVSFMVNAMRIALLLFIGDRVSAEIAINGFHTNFGIVSVMVITAGFAWVIRRLASTHMPKTTLGQEVPQELHEDADVRLAVPLMVAIAAMLLVGLFSGRFNWLYPLPVGLAAVAAWRLGVPDRKTTWELTRLPLAAGLICFLVWIGCVSANAARSAAFEDDLYSAPLVISLVWLLSRLIGSVLIIPVIEELAFRGFLLPLMAAKLAPWLGRRGAAIAALFATSIGFGLVHSQIVAGCLTGLAFGLIYLRRGEVRDAIVAHGAANGLLFFYVMTQSQWSYL